MPLPSDEDLLLQAKMHWKEDRDRAIEWRIEAREDYAFVAGEQWDQQDKQRLKDSLRPIVTFNRIGPVIDAVSGTEIGNRQEVRYIPREQGDVGVNEVLTGAADWVRDECDAEDEESDGFTDTVICGMGWTETRLDTESEENDILIERIDPMEMTWDHAARKRNLGDARRLFRVKDYTKDELEAQWPGKAEEIGRPEFEEEGDDEAESNPHVTVPGDQYRSGSEASWVVDKKNTYRVVEYQWYEREPYHLALDPFSGEMKTLEDGEHKTLIKRVMARLGLEVRSVKKHRRAYYRAFFSGGVVLEAKESPYPKGFTYRCITGKRDRNKGTFYGLVRGMKDPQRWANKFFSTILHQIATSGKGIMAEKAAFDNVRKAEEDWANPDSITWMAQDALAKGRVQLKPGGMLPTGLPQMLEFAISSIRDVSGVNLELLGMADRQQAGVLEYQRKQAGMTILAGLFNSLRRYRKEQGRMLLHFITEYISDGRLIRIVGKEGEQYVPLLKQEGTLTYDVIVDDAPTSPNQKERVWSVLAQMMPMLLSVQLPTVVWTELLKYSPLPAGLTAAISEELRKPNPAAQKQAQLDEAEQQADIGETQSKTELNRAKTEGELAEIGHDATRIENEGVTAIANFVGGRMDAQDRVQR